jgi:hypothetical protein
LLHMSEIWTQEEEAANLARLFEGVPNKAAFVREHKVPGGPSMLSQHCSGHRPIGLDAAMAYARGFALPLRDISPRLALQVAGATSEPLPLALSPEKNSQVGPSIRIPQYQTGGAMGQNGRLLIDHTPGIITSWDVEPEWLRLNVPSHTGIKNLCIVTGFGPSMRPMFNPGDPLLVDTGVNIIHHEGVYFFRVGDEGYIKLIQRVPEFDGPGVILRVISKNPDFPPYDLSPKNPHFQVLGKVLTVWRSEQY